MPGLLDRIGDRLARREERNSIDWWIENYLVPAATQFGFMGHTYQVGGVVQTAMGPAVKEVANALPAYMAALRSCPPAFAAQMVRAAILSPVRFCFRNGPRTLTTPRVFTTKALSNPQHPC